MNTRAGCLLCQPNKTSGANKARLGYFDFGKLCTLAQAVGVSTVAAPWGYSDMSKSGQNPGGGFTSVKGYNDPAGSQAEADRRLREDEARRAADERQRQQQEAYECAETERRRNQEQRERTRQSVTRGSRQPAERARQLHHAEAATRARGSSTPSWAPTAAGQKIGLMAFLAVGGYTGYRTGGEYWWVASLLAGGLAAYIGARFYKHIAVLIVLFAGFWVWDRTKTANVAAPEHRVEVPQTASPPAAPPHPPAQLAHIFPIEKFENLPVVPNTADSQVTHEFNINNGLVPPGEMPAAPQEPGAHTAAAPATPSAVCCYADDMVFSFVGSPLFATGDVLEVSHQHKRYADTGGELRETTLKHRNAIPYDNVLRFAYHVPSKTLAAYAKDGYHAIGEIGGNIITLDTPQQIRLEHESSGANRSYEVIVMR